MAILIDIIAYGAAKADGTVLANGSAYIYSVGTTNLANIYTDKALTIPASNPVTLSSGGKAEVYADEEVRVVLFDSLGAQVDDIESLGSYIKVTNVTGDLNINPENASRVAIFDENKELTTSDTTSAEIGYLSGINDVLQKMSRPSYYCVAADNTQVIVPATSVNKAIVRIGGFFYTNVTDETMDVNTSGRGGIDTGSVAANTDYYLYAIPSTTGTTFDLVCSVTPPSTGPTGFSAWSYIGAFATNEAAATIAPFQASGGVYIADTQFEDETHTGDTNSTAKTFAALPVTAKQAYLNVQITPNAAGQSGRVTGNQSTSNFNLVQFGPVASQKNDICGWVPVFTAQTLYLAVDNASATVAAHLCGFMEAPWEWP